MAEVIKTKYMDKATRGYSEYIARDLNALQTISPKEGDRAILLDGSLYICVDNGIWDIMGSAEENDILIITAGYKTGGERGYTIDKTYTEILSAAEAGKTIIMIDTTVITGAGLPVILYPYSYNSDGSGTFVTIAEGDDMGGSKDYRYSITVYPDNTVIPRWEELSQGGAELNIAYGETAPGDTSKLWIKANEPESIVFDKDFDGVESITAKSAVILEPVWNMGYTKVGTKIYLFGGSCDGTPSYYNSNVYIYDIKTDTVTIKTTNLPSAFVGPTCASMGTDIYIFGGANTYNDTWYNTIYKYDTITDTVTLLETTLPSRMTYMGCVAIGTKIYLLGGYMYSSTYFSNILIFDTEKETITTLPIKLPTGRANMGCTSVGTDIYLFGGNYYNNYYLNSIWKFDTVAETIIVLDAKLPKGNTNMGCISIGNKVYLFGGQIADNTYSDTIYIFDTNEYTITQSSISLPYTLGSMACVSNGTDVYLLGGQYATNPNILKFTASKDLAQNNIEVITGSNHFFNVINTNTMKVEIGINSVLIGNAENKAENCEAYLYQNDAWVQI